MSECLVYRTFILRSHYAASLDIFPGCYYTKAICVWSQKCFKTWQLEVQQHQQAFEPDHCPQIPDTKPLVSVVVTVECLYSPAAGYVVLWNCEFCGCDELTTTNMWHVMTDMAADDATAQSSTDSQHNTRISASRRSGLFSCCICQR